MKTSPLRSCLAAVALAASMWSAEARAASIGVSFGNGTSATTLASTDSAGVAPYAQTNFNNVTTNVTNLALNDSTGVVTTGMLTIASATFARISSGVGADEIFNNGQADNNSGALSFTLTNIPYASYSLVVYDLYDLQGNVQGISVGATTYYTSSPNPSGAGFLDNNAATAFTYTRGTATTQATATVNADYVLFTGLSGSSLTVSLSKPGDIAEVGGFQIIQNVPEPSTWALLGLGVIGLGCVTLRQRRCSHVA